MIRTVLFLLATLIAIPLASFYYDQALGPEQWHTLQNLIYLMLAIAGSCFVVSELSANYSQTDKLWSIVPIVYVWYVAAQSGFSDRLVLMAIMVSIWGARLTFNFARRGGYSWIPWRGEEDYRWAILRQNPAFKSRWAWTLFNLFFISFYQHGLILLFTLPSIAAWQGQRPLNWLDYLAATLMLGFVVLETIADQQQWNFQREKHRRIAAGEALGELYGKGFCSTGLWGMVRHPNYASEQAIWLGFYLFSVAATGRWLNWSLGGAVLLMLLFLGSSDFSEKISAGKYAAYKDYQQKTGRFLPKIF